MTKRTFSWGALVCANLVIWGVLSFYDSNPAVAQPGKPPFSNAVEQRHDIVRELQKITGLLKEQNKLLRDMARQPQEADR